MKARNSLCSLVVLLVAGITSAQGQLFENLEAFGNRTDVGDPEIVAVGNEGPKGLCLADFNQDGTPDYAASNLDGTVSVLLGLGDGTVSPPVHLHTGAQTLRGITCADWNDDGQPDIATAAPYDGKLFLYLNAGEGTFNQSPSQVIDTWLGARNVASGDFDGDERADLVVAGPGGGVRQYRGPGDGTLVPVTTIDSDGLLVVTKRGRFPKPVFTLKALRPDGNDRDDLLVTHADAGTLWRLKPDETGELAITSSMPIQRARSFVVGNVFNPIGESDPDIVTANRDGGTVHVRNATGHQTGFDLGVQQALNVPGGPRAMALTDMDGDGWNDLVVVLRNFDRILVYQNDRGTLSPTAETPVGISPREVVTGDIDDDGYPDVAVINRISGDLTLLRTIPGEAQPAVLDQVYPVHGEVRSLRVSDFNGDGRDDVMQLHAGSWDVSIRYANEDGSLGEPEITTLGIDPSAEEILDVNNDGLMDLIATNLKEPGSISVRLGSKSGGFEKENVYNLPREAGGGLLSIIAADFDNDGNIDLASGYRDCRLSFSRGDGEGNFEFTNYHNFVHEPLDMVTADFDNDGDMDIAGVGYEGDIVVVENEGDLLETSTIKRMRYQHENPKTRWSSDIRIIDTDQDGNLDLVASSGTGVMLLLGRTGIEFDQVARTLSGSPRIPVSSMVEADFDNDGRQDMAISCQILSCVTIMIRDEQLRYVPALTVDVPSARFVAAGDLDGDGLTDLVGGGSTLWTALSSRPGKVKVPDIPTTTKKAPVGLVINEVMAATENFKLPSGKRTDWIELYHSGPGPIDVKGWKLEVIRDDRSFIQPLDSVVPVARFGPPEWILQEGERLLISEDRSDPNASYLTTRLPKEGATVRLIDATGDVRDAFTYPRQREDASYGRFVDGGSSYVFNPIPSPGGENMDNGPLPPLVVLEGFDVNTYGPDQPIRFYAHGEDDSFIVSLSILYRRMDIIDETFHRVVLYDDGMHEDGRSQDGTFSGLLDPLPAGAEIEFYLEAVDFSNQTVNVPAEPTFRMAGEPTPLYSLAIPSTPRPAIEISEVVASNRGVIRDETGRAPDYIELRNISSEPVSLAGYALSEFVYGLPELKLQLPPNVTLAPGQHVVVFADRDVTEGPLHAPFKIKRTGEPIVLTKTTALGATMLVDSVNSGILQTNEALFRSGPRGEWMVGRPTPGSTNGGTGEASTMQVLVDNAQVSVIFDTQLGEHYQVERSTDLTAWESLTEVDGSGFEQVFTEATELGAYYRVRSTR